MILGLLNMNQTITVNNIDMFQAFGIVGETGRVTASNLSYAIA